jgi:putative oxidoreductase
MLRDVGLLLLRLALAGVLLFHGAYKVMHGVEWMKPLLAALGLPGALAYGAYVAEVLAPSLIIVGYKTRVAALVVAFDMIMAFVLVLRPHMFEIKAGGGGLAVEVEALILFSALALALTGGGRFGIVRPPTRWE